MRLKCFIVELYFISSITMFTIEEIQPTDMNIAILAIRMINDVFAVLLPLISHWNLFWNNLYFVLNSSYGVSLCGYNNTIKD